MAARQSGVRRLPRELLTSRTHGHPTMLPPTGQESPRLMLPPPQPPSDAQAVVSRHRDTETSPTAAVLPPGWSAGEGPHRTSHLPTLPQCNHLVAPLALWRPEPEACGGWV